MKNINNKWGLVLTLMLTGTLLITGCSSTKGIVGTQNLNTNSSGYITSFDFLKNVGNSIDSIITSFDSSGAVISSGTSNIVVITTDYVTSNAVLNHSILFRSGYYDNFAKQTTTELWGYDRLLNVMKVALLFPSNQSFDNTVYLGQETISSVFGDVLCTKIRTNNPDGSYSIVWIHQKYFSLRSESYSTQNIKTTEFNVTQINF